MLVWTKWLGRILAACSFFVLIKHATELRLSEIFARMVDFWNTYVSGVVSLFFELFGIKTPDWLSNIIILYLLLAGSKFRSMQMEKHATKSNPNNNTEHLLICFTASVLWIVIIPYLCFSVYKFWNKHGYDTLFGRERGQPFLPPENLFYFVIESFFLEVFYAVGGLLLLFAINYAFLASAP